MNPATARSAQAARPSLSGGRPRLERANACPADAGASRRSDAAGAAPSGRGLPYLVFFFFFGVGLSFGIGLLGAAPAAALDFDRPTWSQMLERHTASVSDAAGTRVDYAAMVADPEWRRFVDDLARRAPPPEPAGRMAFWIDAYNVLAIDMVVRHWPVESIRDAGSFFKRVWSLDAGAVDGRRVTLDEIEHQILRPLGDPRIHMAIVCASTSCPSLARTPFHAEDLDARLDAAVARFLGDPRKGLEIDRARGRIRVSRIFAWFDDDFEKHGGVIGFVREHLADVRQLDAADRAWLESAGPNVPIDYFDYDWTVNALRR